MQENNEKAVGMGNVPDNGARAVKKMVKGMKEKLAKKPKVTIKIPVDNQNKKDTTVTVQINGYVFTMKRGVEISVPKVVKDILERGGYM